jgi:hypothetical protein
MSNMGTTVTTTDKDRAVQLVDQEAFQALSDLCQLLVIAMQDVGRLTHNEDLQLPEVVSIQQAVGDAFYCGPQTLDDGHLLGMMEAAAEVQAALLICYQRSLRKEDQDGSTN